MWKILAVDDDQGILAVIRKALEKEGYLVDTFITEVCFFCKVSCDKVRNAIF